MSEESAILEDAAEVNNENLPEESETSEQQHAEAKASENETSETETAATFAPSHKETVESKRIIELDLLEEEFENYMRIANAFLRTLRRPKDVDICNNLMRKVQKLNYSKHLEVKRNNNRFFRHFLRVLKLTSITQPLHWYSSNVEESGSERESANWLVDKKYYMAVKSYKDGTSVIYTAVAYDPEAGWQYGGLKTLALQGVCEN